jgi:hypothetical protein
MTLGQWTVNDVREVIRLALIGGGMKPTPAFMLVKRYCDDRPLGESLAIAHAVLLSAVVGVPGDDVGKEPADLAATGATASSDPLSTGSGLQ